MTSFLTSHYHYQPAPYHYYRGIDTSLKVAFWVFLFVVAFAAGVSYLVECSSHYVGFITVCVMAIASPWWVEPQGLKVSI